MKDARILVLMLAVTLSGCASQASLDNMRNDIDSIKSRLFSMDREFSAIREEYKVSAVAIEKGFKADVAAVRKMSADIQATIDSTKSELQAMNGKVDDTAVAIRKPAEELTRYREDADRRIVALEQRLLKQQTQLDALAKTADDAAKAKKTEAAAPPAPVPSPVQLTPEAIYNKALDLSKAGEYPASREQFNRFLEQSPKHELAANAHYWIGETHYSEKNYELAILSYQEVIKNYPNKEKVIAAMLKQAMAFNAINDSKSAKYVLKKLVENYPKSEEAKRAKALLKEIK